VAIVGIGGIFPGAPDLEQFWANITAAHDATRDVPPGRWPIATEDVLDPRVGQADKVYSMRGGFIEDFRLDPEGLDLDRGLLDRLDPMFRLALHAGRQAWRDAVTERLDRRRVGVVMGNIVLPTESASALARAFLGRSFDERVEPAGDRDERDWAIEPLNRCVAGLPAGLLAQALGLGGGAYTLDAACASSLYALKLAADELLAGRADAMLTGGLSRPDSLYTQMGFAQLRALSVAGKPCPFDARADGLVVAEGAGMFVLKRLDDALHHGDTIYGVIAGAGLSNDVDGGLLAPSSEGQLRAMRAAYAEACWEPSDVDLIECHATGTPVGDAVEFASLRALWGERGDPAQRGRRWSEGECIISSVKSNIGHALTAAGAAGLLKVLLALKHKLYPPTANFAAPSPTLGYDASPFRVLTEPRAWEPRAAGCPRRAAISGFGFGGINAHVLIEEWTGIPGNSALPDPGSSGSSVTANPSPIAIVGMAAHFGPFRGLRAFQERVLGGAIAGGPEEPRHWWGAQQSSWYRRAEFADQRFPGYYIDSPALPADRFRIPPRELEEMLPQQSLALLTAAEASADAGWDESEGPRLRAGVFVGIGLDLNTTNFHLRWLLPAKARAWNRRRGLDLSEDELNRWTAALREAAGPALSANRTMGALGGLVASRIARELRLGGPSFTVSSEETSGARALEVAVRLLQRGELDQAIVAAVDLPGDVRSVLATHRLQPFSASGTVQPLDAGADGSIPGDGAAAVVLKRLDDAVESGDRIYAVVRGIGSASGPGPWAYLEALERGYHEAAVAPASIGYLEAHGSGRPDEDRREATALAEFSRRWPAEVIRQPTCALGSSKADVGHAGAAAALAGLVKSALCLYQQILPALRSVTNLRTELVAGGSPYFLPRGPQYWLRDRALGPRRAAASAQGIDGNVVHVILEAHEPAATITSDERRQPLGARPVALFAIEGDDQASLTSGIEALDQLAAAWPTAPIEALARRWWRDHPGDPDRRLGLAVVADRPHVLRDRLAAARRRGAEGVDSPFFVTPRDRPPLGQLQKPEGVALVFPGIGNQFAGMGRALSAGWPEILRAQDQENGLLRAQLAPGTHWNSDPPERLGDQRAPILGQVVLGTIVSDWLRSFGIVPAAMIGYSLGESAGLFALRAWTERDEMLRRLEASPLFRTELAGPCDAARRAWGLAPSKPVDWRAGIVACPAETVRVALEGRSRVYLLIVNAPGEVVIGGARTAVERLVGDLGCPFVPLPMVSTVHCPVARQVEAAYRTLHHLTTSRPPGITFYSGGWGRAYTLDRFSAADAIVAQALHTVDFQALIERAYADGLRVFIEAGPGGSCSRMIGATLGDRPHLARPACLVGQDPLATLLDLLGRLIAERIRVDLGALYGQPTSAVGSRLETPGEAPSRFLTVAGGGQPFSVPMPTPVPKPQPAPIPDRIRTAVPAARESAPATATGATVNALLPSLPPSEDRLTQQFSTAETAKAEAHEAYLRVSGNIAQTLSNQLAFQMALIEALISDPADDTVPARGGGPGWGAERSAPAASARPALDRAQCLEFATGSIGTVLGPEFAAIDAHPTRVRLPDEPLMLVDRITAIEAEPRSLTSGRVVTEHDVLPRAWYLDCGRIPACIAIEAGQADLFLSAYLGIDFVTRGMAVYRLLDAAVTFHRGLPEPGAVIRYDIQILHFFRQGDTHLFRFQFDATVHGVPLLSMRDGCAGFFTAQELAAGKGVVPTPLDLAPRAGVRPDDWIELASLRVESYTASQLDALRRGDLGAAFGRQFAALDLHDPVRLPGGRMTLVQRVPLFDPAGGRYGLGFIRAEADIDPDAWFMTCHFVDDRVMPGTLMYECCLHALRVYLMRLGWVAEQGPEVVFEPVPGVASRLRCRGQVVESTKTVTYEITIKELGYRPEPYALADALMLADGRPIVEITDMALRLAGVTRDDFERMWERARARPAASASNPTLASPASGIVHDRQRILAFATGKPSEAFGAPYRVFDEGRFIARLPAPPFSFVDRITSVTGEPWKMAAGSEAIAEYDVPVDAWYLAADRQERMPFAVLLEVALQPCGWLAAYMGSVLTSDVELRFRNLGGSAVQLEAVNRQSGTLSTRVCATKVARSAGMIIQHYDFEVSAGNRPVYRGDTYFGFFQNAALADQVGLREATPYAMRPEERTRARVLAYPSSAPFPDERWRMVDRIDALALDGGPRQLGFIAGSKTVDPGAWFFQAHFHQDPVWPGSLGLESLLQLLKVVAVERWAQDPAQLPALAFASPCLGERHRWLYRGQVLPGDHMVTVEAAITAVDDRSRRLTASGLLAVDGRIIYQMDDFTLGLDRHTPHGVGNAPDETRDTE
jgi:acyl transferase domain-containing protein/3-hydroxymyristoyl/3-hydroxydecanoyl-(acyl carrier protein) dehydratase